MKKTLLFAGMVIGTVAFSQKPSFSVASQFSLLRNVTRGQKFWAAGQHVQANLHLSPKETAYASIEYYTEGTFENNFTATAKQATSTPQTFPFTAKGTIRFRELSLGLKHYFRGGHSHREGINFFGTAGFGFLFARMSNSFSPPFDTTVYSSPIVAGRSIVKRLSFDAGLGAETHIRGPVFVFATMRTWLPASYQPSRYLHNSDRMPLTVMGGVGVRVLFGFTY
jgi:hypothetical protein